MARQHRSRAQLPSAIWFARNRWRPFNFQQAVWDAVTAGSSGLLHSSTGSGKTYALWFAALDNFCSPQPEPVSETSQPCPAKKPHAPHLTVLWITPMRALANDTGRALQKPLEDLGMPWTLGVRTGDTPARERAQQDRRLPTVLVTTPESLTLLLTRAEPAELFRHLQMVVVDEWHELLGNKRGTQAQLALARLRRWNPELITWGLSATLGNVHEALDVLVPSGGGQIIEGDTSKPLQVDTLLPSSCERFPWAGHLGLRMLPNVIAEIESSASTLVFTNTRAQSELWYQALLDARPDWAGLIALHHGSLDRKVRDWVEQALKEGRLKAVVCTSSLDLGVDFLPVERVLQIGSAKGVARLLQRAGRAGHSPGRSSRVTLIPTNSLEIIEASAAKAAVAAKAVEARQPPRAPMDVLVQHLVTIALGGGFRDTELLQEIRSCYSYRELSDDEWAWALAFVQNGGQSLSAYPDYHRITADDDGIWRVTDRRLARRHRLNIGTITSDSSMSVRYWSKGGAGGRLGTVEESFIARMKPGDHFLFAGKQLELVRVQDMTAYVRRTEARKPAVPRWNGGRMPLSSELADTMLLELAAVEQGDYPSIELASVKPLLELQRNWSRLPTPERLLAEVLKSREGWHLFMYPFAGRNVNLGIANLLAWRLARTDSKTFTFSVNDYGFELLSLQEIDWRDILSMSLLDPSGLVEDLQTSLAAGELPLRRFREIARIAGLVYAGQPGAYKSTRQLQASSKLFYEVFRRHDPHNRLLRQAHQEVLREELEVARFEAALMVLQGKQLDIVSLKRPSPFAFPLLVSRMRESLSTEKLTARIARMIADLEKAAGDQNVSPTSTITRGQLDLAADTHTGA